MNAKPEAPGKPKPDYIYFCASDPYFGAGDPSFNAAAYFHEKLTSHVLFQPHMGLMSDQFFLFPAVADHLQGESGDSLLEQVLKYNLIRPCFRSGDTFTTAQAAVLADYQQNSWKTSTALTASKIARRLNDSLQGSESWGPENYSMGYQDTLEQVLTDDLPSEDRYKDVSQYWPHLSPWRSQLISAAKEKMKSKPIPGIQRGTLYSLLSESVGGDPSVSTLEGLLAAAQEPAKKVHAQLFGKIMNECYFVNQARMFGAFWDFENFDALSSIVARKQNLQLGEGGSSRPFIVPIELPPMARMMALPPTSLISLRIGSGNRYFRALKAWMQEAKSLSEYWTDIRYRLRAEDYEQAKRRDVESALKSYAADIREACGDRTQREENLASVALQAGKDKAIGQLYETLDAKQPGLSVVSRLGSAFYRRVVSGTKKSHIHISSCENKLHVQFAQN